MKEDIYLHIDEGCGGGSGEDNDNNEVMCINNIKLFESSPDKLNSILNIIKPYSVYTKINFRVDKYLQEKRQILRGQ